MIKTPTSPFCHQCLRGLSYSTVVRPPIPFGRAHCCCPLLFFLSLVESEILGTAIAFLHFQSKARSGFIIEGDGTKIHVCRVVGVRKQRRPKHALGVIKIKGRVVWELSKNLP
ncbi:hypothetical protein ES332_A01G171300v1 [Gossypium tomentosum]|uniref:Uncharacterized protein n=1 Tax=Gossypium tomentosum TaxID=34277 RepID=A0A5D2RSF4_GOSTO|nr:hypothetical protein ES332_A01G171300v1 [Gossypium tomentosum]